MPIPSRLTMIDELGGRNRIIPAEVTGFFRKWRNYVHLILLFIFLGLPWVHIHGTQAILLDVPGRRFELFGQIFLSHDSPLLFFLAAIAVLSIALSTALFGRVWCGWACPQTVFIEAVYRRIEIWVEGNYIQRRKLSDAPMSFEKAFKLSLKWVLYFVFSSLFAHSFIAYFTGSRQLIEMMKVPPHENWSYFLIVTFVTALLMFNFGWFREQFCIIMCPYGRFQSVLLDQQSITIVYDQNRGEPRRGLATEGGKKGSCISCNRCVQVCPVAIDIRNGSQMECIGCTACIDACDEIMAKVNEPPGLISYNASVPRNEIQYLRPRILVYLSLILVCCTGLGYNLYQREPFNVLALRAKDSPYQISTDGKILNHFKINLHNQSHLDQDFEISLPNNTQMQMTQVAAKHEVSSGETKDVHVFISFTPNILNESGKAPFLIRVTELKSQQSRDIEMVGIGPIPNK